MMDCMDDDSQTDGPGRMPDGQTPHRRFTDLTRRLVRVPKAEIDAERDNEQKRADAR